MTGTGETRWTAHDIAAVYGWTLEQARAAMNRWIGADMVTVLGRAALTNARMVGADRVRAARAADLAELADQDRVHRPAH